MGGRGSTSIRTINLPSPDPIERNYEIITTADLKGRATYAFLDKLARNWAVLTSPASQPGDYLSQDTFGMDQPTLRWVNGDQIIDLFVDGMNTEEFLQQTGLELSLHKGGFVLSKRLSRILRPQYVTAFFDSREIDVRYMDLHEGDLKIWDGAGLISRAMLERMIEQLSDVSPAKRAQLMRELKHGQRVEFTLMTAKGQDKGHAIVSDRLQSDFLLPRDTKAEVKLVNGQTFVGINFVHAHTDMRLDIQSLINLYPFFEEEQLAQWLHEEGELFIRSIESGDVGSAMARIDRFTTLDEVQSWPLREYLASGGDPMCFASHVKSFANQHLARLNYSTLGKMRLPIPGGRLYVMPVGVGQQAGLHVQVGRGEIYLDPKTATAWVNDDDWLQLEGSQEGIAGILGGADNDDALWLHNFTDYDGEHKVLAWRSPNQAGEYVILKPTQASHTLEWETLEGRVSFPSGDSRKLMPRIDSLNPDYLNLIDPATAGGLGEGQDYNIDVMQATIERVIANKAALGAYCNALMLSKALYNQLPAHPPAPLEDVIDGSVKLGTDLSPILEWTQSAASKILQSRKPIPANLQERLGPVPDGTPRPVTSVNHWMDRLVNRVQDHIQHIETQRDRLIRQTMPPRAIFDYTFDKPESIQLGAKLNQLYTRALKQIARSKPNISPQDYDLARIVAEQHLHKFPSEMQSDILRGAIVSAYLRDEPTSDVAVWLAGERIDGGRKQGIGGQTIHALREIGILDEISDSESGLITYPGAMTKQAQYQTIGIQGVWRGFYEDWARARNLNPDDISSKLTKKGIRFAKEQVFQFTKDQRSIQLHTREEIVNDEARKVAYDESGNRFGLISRDSEKSVDKSFTVKFTIAHDGNLRAVIEADDEIKQ